MSRDTSRACSRMDAPAVLEKPGEEAVRIKVIGLPSERRSRDGLLTR